MFEQSVLQPETDKKGWTFAASILVEVSVVSLMLLVPLIYTERLGLGWIQSSALRVAPPLPPPMPAEPMHDRPIKSRATKVWNPLTPSTHLRPVVDLLKDLPDDPGMPQVCPACVIGAPVTDNVWNAVNTGQSVTPPPKPQPKPVEVKKPADPAPTAPINVSKGAQEAKIIRRIIPAYPSLAKQARVQGTVKLLGVISTEGRIEKLQVISGHPLLVQAAVDAVKQWLYRPTLLNGQPVEVMAPIDVNFILSN